MFIARIHARIISGTRGRIESIIYHYSHRSLGETALDPDLRHYRGAHTGQLRSPLNGL